MQKNRKRAETLSINDIRARRSFPIHFPEVFTIDDLGMMLDEDLAQRLRLLEEEKNKMFESYVDTKPWEEEVAYVRREQQIRRVRREAHLDYVRKYEDEFMRSEAGLPAGDFDNSAFVYAATGGRPRWN